MEQYVKVFFVLILITSSQILSQNEKPTTTLPMAVFQGNLEIVKQYIELGSDLNEKDQFGSTPLIVAITFGKNEIAKELIEAGANLSIANNEGSTPLHIAAFFCRKEIVRTLLDNGADRDVRNESGATAMDIVSAPFEWDKSTYDKLTAALGPLGLKLDYEYIKSTRPEIFEMLKPDACSFDYVDYTPQVRDDWVNSTPGEQGIKAELVDELYLDASELETLYGLILIKNGYLIAEKYFNVGSIDELSKRASVTKSYVSAMMGIAIANGCIKSVDQKMLSFFPEYEDKITDKRKEEITIQNMLQMRDGYPWEETDTTYWNIIWSGEYISAIEKVPLSKDVGSEFQYSNLTSNWLSMIITRACGTDLKSFGEKYLFKPLGVKIGDWNQDIDGYYIGSGDIEFTVRDMAKFGLLYLNNGKYNDQQIVPENWVEESFKNYSDEINCTGVSNNRLGRYFYDVGYGYQWWSAKVGDRKFNFAWGHGGQLIVLLKDLDMIIVTTADSFHGKKEHFTSWKYEQSIINVVGKFINSLPKEG